MRRTILLVVSFVVLCTTGAHSQAIFRVTRPLLKKPVTISKSLRINRVTVIETRHIERAVRAAEFQSRLRQQEALSNTPMIAAPNVNVAFLTQNIEQHVCKPEQLYGGYNYLRTCSKNMKTPDWVHINKTTSYNGVHHIINVQTLKELYKVSLESYEKGKIELYPFFNDMVLNAPGMFHKFHNNPEFVQFFHNSALQLEIYNDAGIKGVLDYFFENMVKLNIEQGLKPIDQEIIDGTYLEAELWTTHFGLDWEK